jgi:hypothetical protein
MSDQLSFVRKNEFYRGKSHALTQINCYQVCHMPNLRWQCTSEKIVFFCEEMK